MQHYLPSKLKVNVLRKHLLNGEFCKPETCPISLAVLDAIRCFGIKEVVVRTNPGVGTGMTITADGLCYTPMIPDEALVILKLNDQRKITLADVTSFWLDLSAPPRVVILRTPEQKDRARLARLAKKLALAGLPKDTSPRKPYENKRVIAAREAYERSKAA